MPSTPLVALATAVLDVPRAPERILDIGCGEGDATLFLAREYPTARVRGVDGSPDAIRAAVARIGLDPEGRVAFKHGRRRSLPFPDDFFDLVVQTHGALYVGEAIRVLRPQGHLLFVESPRWSLPLVAGPRALERGLKRRGLEIVGQGEADGARFFLARLGAAQATSR